MIAHTEKTGDSQADLILKNNYTEVEADWKKTFNASRDFPGEWTLLRGSGSCGISRPGNLPGKSK